MHELSITQSMFDLVMEQAKQQEAKKITQINVVIGAMTGVVADCVQFYFDIMSKDTIAEGAELSIQTIPARATCLSCKKTSELQEFEWSCPKCKGEKLEIVSGKELFVESIEIE